MKYCTSCGAELKGKKFCIACGKQTGKEHLTHTPHAVSATSIAIIIIGIFIFAIFFLGNTETKDLGPIGPSELTDTLKEVRAPQSQQITVTKKREGFSLNEKPFAPGNYDYDERSPDFRLVCAHPCPVSRTVLEQEFAAITYGVSTLRGLTNSNIDKSILPFEVHATEDAICPKIDAPAYMSTFTDTGGYTRGKLCFLFDKVEYDRSKFPYSTSVHEITHLFQRGRFPPYQGSDRILTEGLSMVLDSFFEKGSVRDSFCWQGNAWYSKVAQSTDSVHKKGASLFFELCNQYGFDYDSLPELFRQLDVKSRPVTTQEFINIINSITGKDTSHLFKKVGVI